jgi:DNA-binding NtrC family response regulator
METRYGRFELARAGTLLLDEISEIPVRLQAKLLRVLEEEAIERVGGTKRIELDVRVLATTNRSLEQEVALGNFRRDLYYRLNVTQLHAPPLRSRREDILPLAKHFLAKYRGESPAPVQAISRKVEDILTAHDWPGNVRELRNCIRHACIYSTGAQIQPQDLPRFSSAPRVHTLLTGTLEDIERQVILRTLQELGGNKTAAAERLGVTPRTLLNKMNRYRQLGVASAHLPLA